MDRCRSEKSGRRRSTKRSLTPEYRGEIAKEIRFVNERGGCAVTIEAAATGITEDFYKHRYLYGATTSFSYRNSFQKQRKLVPWIGRRERII